MAETQSRDGGEKIIAQIKEENLFPKKLIEFFESIPRENVPFFYAVTLIGACNSKNRALGEKLVADLKERREIPKIVIETLEKMWPQDIPVFISAFLKNFDEEGDESDEECEEESEDECEEESKEKSKERSLTQNNWLKKSFDFLLLSAEFVVECKKAYDTAKVAYEKDPVNACISFLADGVISENKSKTFTEIEKMPLRDYIEMCKKKLVGRS